MEKRRLKRSSAPLRWLVKKVSPKGHSAVNNGIPVRDGGENLTQVPDPPAQASLPVQASVQANGPPGAATLQEPTRAAKNSNQSDGPQSVTATQRPTVSVQSLTQIANPSDLTAAQESTEPVYQPTQRDSSSADARHQSTSSAPVGSVAAAAVTNDTREPAIDNLEPPRLPAWEKAVNSLKANKPEVFKNLETMKKNIKEREKNFSLKEPPTLLELFEKKKRKAGGIPQWAQSMFRSILTVKDVFTVVAVLDPHHAAPVFWRGFCVILEALLNDATFLEDTDLNLSDVTSKIKYWANIEIFYIGACSRATEDGFKALETGLIVLYTSILEFEVEVFHWCNHGLLVQRLLSPERKERWKSIIAKVKTNHDICSSIFDDCKTRINQHKKIKSWISTYRAADAHADIIGKNQVHEKYQNSGQWLIDSAPFKNWSSTKPKITGNVFWLRGTIGTGKTTLLCQIIQWHLERRCLYPDHRFAFFYCTGDEKSKTPYDEVLLALLRQAAYGAATGTISRNVLDAYKRAGADVDDLKPFLFGTSRYQELLGGILKSGIRLRIMIDALDQCNKPAELLKVLRDASRDSPGQLELLVSSRGHVQVEKKLPDVVTVDINTLVPVDDMVDYITTEIKLREKDERLFEGQDEELEDELIRILCEKAGSMFRWVELQLSFFLNPDRTMFKDEVRKNLEKLKKGPVANEESLYAAYDETFERNTRDSNLGRSYAIKIYRMLLCYKTSLSLHAVKPALALDKSNTDIESLSPATILRLTRDFTYLTPNSQLKFAHVSAIDYLRNYRPDHEEYSDAVCHAEMALMCIKCMTSPTHPGDPSLLIPNTFPWYASYFWVEHCAQLGEEDRKSRGVSETLFSWLVKDAGGTAFSHGFCKIPGIKIAMLVASICNFVEIGLEVIQSRLSAHESLSDLLSAEDAEEFPQALRDYTANAIEFYRTRWTPLTWAALYGNEDMAELLLKYDKKPNPREPLGRTALSFEAENGHEVIVGKFISYEENINRDSPDLYGHTPLSYAARRGHLEMVQLLLRFGADPNIQSRAGQTPLLHAVWNGHLAIVKVLLLEKGVDCNHRNKFGRTPLLYAAKTCNLEMAQLLLEFGADLESKDDSDWTPLLHAVKGQWSLDGGNLNMIQLLLQSGADPESKDDSDRTPLSYASEGWYMLGASNQQIFQLLLDYGADPESKDDSDRTPLSYAAGRSNLKIVQLLLEYGADQESKDNSNRTPLSHAAEEGSGEIVQLLLKYGGDLESKDNSNRTPLLHAVEGGSGEIVQLLLEFGADLESKDDSHRTPLSYAAESSNLEIAQLLLESGADQGSEDLSRRTPLLYAAGEGYLEIVQLLLQYGADPGTRDASHRTPQSYAAERGHPEMIWLLDSAGRNGTQNGGADSNV